MYEFSFFFVLPKREKSETKEIISILEKVCFCPISFHRIVLNMISLSLTHTLSLS